MCALPTAYFILTLVFILRPVAYAKMAPDRSGAPAGVAICATYSKTTYSIRTAASCVSGQVRRLLHLRFSISWSI
jgi:hypothetical protein